MGSEESARSDAQPGISCLPGLPSPRYSDEGLEKNANVIAALLRFEREDPEEGWPALVLKTWSVGQ